MDKTKRDASWGAFRRESFPLDTSRSIMGRLLQTLE